ncbi:MAG TPA: hypothetical protein VFK05_28090 [Polyangiaceae bacterium]|nr:hypothetical protein [Polyangiaceae bacterium]
MAAVRFCSALCGLLLTLLPALAHAQQRKPVLRPGPFGLRNCEAELALRAEMGGPDFSALGQAIEIGFAALSPHVGVIARVDGTVRASLLMPMSVPIGPSGPTRTLPARDRCTHDEREEFRPFRISLEPGLLLQKYPTGFVRASFRSIWHPLNSFVGAGAGFGAIADWQNGTALGFSSELLLQLGGCCKPPFWQLSVRRDQYPADRDREAFVFVFGPTVW